uniref:Uncharacterized protein n=1 Tax=Kalanchoe fedtschenkoi TaxID=63787 RepID=A0A7N0T4P1_KALFE
MSKGPSLFSDIGKKPRDLLTRDYNADQRLSVSTYSSTGVALTSSAGKKGGFSTGDVAAVYKYKNTLIDAKVDTASTIATSITFFDVFPSTKAVASIKLPDYTSGKLEAQYFHDHATFTTAVSLNQTPVVDLSATLGNPTIAFGAEAGYETSTGNFTKYTAGIGVTQPDSSASVLLGDKGDSLKVSFVKNLDKLKRTNLAGEFSRRFSTNENTVTVGCSHIIDPLTQVKVKLNNHGQLATVLQHEVIPKSLLTISTEFDTKALDKTPKFGLALALKP